MSGMFSSPTPPPIPKPTLMPDAQSSAIARKRKQSLKKQQSRGGRQSTILTDEKLGG